MSLQFRVGHIYSPPTVGKDATIFDWFSCSQHIVETLKGAFLKVAHVLPSQVNLLTMDTEDAYESVYMDICQQADLTPFTIPYGWKQLWVYMDNDLITRPVIQKDIEPGRNIVLTDHCAPLSGSQFSDAPSWVDTGFDEAFLDDNFLSAIGSFKPDGEWTGTETLVFGIGFQMSATGDYILPSTSAAANMELHPLVPVTVSTGSKHNTMPPELTTFLPILITGIALANSPLPKSHYVICDPALFTRGIEYTNETLEITFPVAAACIRDATILARQCLTTHGIQENSFCIACKDFIIEMMTVTKHAGQPVEQGFKCRDTNKVKPLDMKYYRWMPILVILALCILQPLRVQHRLLLDLFPTQYGRLPEHLIASACRMYTIFFKCRLPGYPPSAQISTDDFEKEADHQLQLLRFICQHTNEEAHRLNTWINTRDGPGGWLQDL